MTVTEILDDARNSLNAASDPLWSDTELYLKLYKVMSRFCRRVRCVRGTDSSTSTAIGTADYNYPAAYAFETWRLEYNGRKLQIMDRRQYDSMVPTGNPGTGTPSFYIDNGTSITLYPTPADVQVLKFYTYNVPSAVPTGATVLAVPAAYHDVLCSGLTAEMCPKDVGNPLTSYWLGRFENEMREAESTEKRRRRADRFATVKIEEESLTTELGII